MIPPHATDIGISKYKAAFLLSMMGIYGGVASLVVGWFADINFVKKKHIYQAATVGSGVVLCLFPLARQYMSLAVMAGLISVFVRPVTVLAPVMLAEELGLANMPITTGLMYRFVFRVFLYMMFMYDANCTGVKGEHCSVDAAPGGDVMATLLDYSVYPNFEEGDIGEPLAIGTAAMVAAIVNLAEPLAARYARKQTREASSRDRT
ncbi:hypothetical protein NP493_5g13015 [Ridgeia piscesae]|uniref:Uncharacterized protein n=1 Tax=Ridgeia piscesae TaxID=27915 RepID=A0AAD9PFI4_RIDPI|nr:hypothetical protein NP493_5g13015 [Ridgeia piscesae]